MSDKIANNSFWMSLIEVSDVLGKEYISIEQIVYLLTGVEEGYEDIFDPVNAYEEYVAIKLCSAIREKLERALIGSSS